ncbi:MULTISPECIES: hypothetical protein [unclassified Duganella]|uniref:hypothetical protein n=1 Tax=unclassified Duganella TaxID=2636909 RepID=UPI00088E38AD|nr:MULTISPECIES: hypothetical protein [unclassified Duganella]SDH43931.1 hypothetical protein SAMN05216320_11394 [Duganella sp. OV458]SDK58556.1 hypothetical protein SAMN05428973_11368 [Duganella sp. OV510]
MSSSLSSKFAFSVLVVLLAAILFFCGVASAIVITNVMEIKEGASWVQAIGGFLAIVAAFMIGNSQAKAAIAAVGLADRLSYARKCNALLAVASELTKVSEKAFEVYKTRHELMMKLFAGEWTLPLETLLEELADIRAHEFGDQDVLTTVVSLKVASSYLKNMLDKMPAAIDDIDNENNWNRFDHLLNVIDINRKLIAKASETLGERLRPAIVSHSS